MYLDYFENFDYSKQDLYEDECCDIDSVAKFNAEDPDVDDFHDIYSSDVRREFLVSKFLEILDETFRVIISESVYPDRYIIILLLQGQSKKVIADCLKVPIHQVKATEEYFCRRSAEMLEKRFQLPVDEVAILQYVKDLKNYKNVIRYEWESWTKYRENVKDDKEQKIISALKKEIERYMSKESKSIEDSFES